MNGGSRVFVEGIMEEYIGNLDPEFIASIESFPNVTIMYVPDLSFQFHRYHCRIHPS